MDLLTTPPAASDSALGVFSSDKIPIPPGKTAQPVIVATRKSCDVLEGDDNPLTPRASLKSLGQVANDNMHEPLSVAAYMSTTNASPSAMVDGVDNSGWLFSLSADPSAKTGVFERAFYPPIRGSGYTKLDLMPITEYIMNHVGSLPLPSISSFHWGIDGCNSNDREQTSHLSAVRQLANFNVALDECATNLPSMIKGDADSLDASGNIECSSRQSRIFAIDELLRLSNDFIVVLKYLSLVECEINAPMDPNQPSVQMVLNLHIHLPNDASLHGILVCAANGQRVGHRPPEAASRLPRLTASGPRDAPIIDDIANVYPHDHDALIATVGSTGGLVQSGAKSFNGFGICASVGVSGHDMGYCDGQN
ncbi:hypothetical protein V500_01480 [Pseudogymnoascus sp. VKM F-4518 (FW-2643)]|nr:hypothetical protein V500_01480 [Pseudogymnoascus sp. VKM F-4518 (FW-2643)]